MRTIVCILAATVLLASACSLYEGDDAPALDAGPTCEPTADRNVSCRSICRADVELCEGADWTVCFAECQAGEALTAAWCPGQRGAVTP